MAANMAKGLSHQINLPPPPPPSPTSDSAIDVAGMQETSSSASQGDRLTVVQNDLLLPGGSLSDNSHERRMGASSANREAFALKRHMLSKLNDWKRANKIITHIRDNPFQSHIECLEQLEAMSSDNNATNIYNDDSEGHHQVGASQQAAVAESHQVPGDERLQSYATHLSCLYKKNQTLMDNNSDFRSLLYNIICCLLTQDERILATPSVTKMIDVIRTHLETASRFFHAAATQTLNPNNQQHQLPASLADYDKGRKHSLGSQNSSSSTATATTTASLSSSAAGPSQPQHAERVPTSQPAKRSSREKPVEFWRVSSVSYDDETLINDLCTGCNEMSVGESQCSDTSGQPSVAFANSTPVANKESPWRFEELSAESKHCHTSQSSLERDSTTMTCDLIQADKSLYNFSQAIDEFMFASSARGTQKRHSDIGEFKPKRPLSYVSSDDNLSQRFYCNDSEHSIYDDESHSNLQSRERRRRSTDQAHEQQPVDVASRRAELEWTLNKLINLELKYTWLTSKDTLRRAIRKVGVPNEIRGKVWLILIGQMIGTKYDAAKLLQQADKTLASGVANQDEESQGILKQIDLDVNRTMPGHKMFDDGAEGGVKLRRILVAYSLHVNRAIAYCQGFNFIVALLLSVLDGDEEKALRGFVCVVDHIFPSKFYFDHYLTGARADQFLLADFICDQLIKNPTSTERKMVEGVTSSITLNWFISLFHGAVPTLTRLTILDHFMLEGVKALFRFTMAILYLAFQVTPPSSCEVYATIRNTAKDMYDIKLLLSIVEQIKLPKDSYFAIRRSFYMVQSSFNSDQFYMQSLSNDASLKMVSNKPLSVQQPPYTKQPAVSLISHNVGANNNSSNTSNQLNATSSGKSTYGGPRVCTSSDRTKVCIQTLGKLGRSHLKIMDANVRSNERSLISPLRNCLVIGIADCGKNILMARQASRRGYKTFREQDLMFHVHELCAEIFDGFYLQANQLALISTHSGDIIKIDVSKCYADSQLGSTETLSLRDSQSFIGEHEKFKLRLVSIDALTNLLWVHIECEDATNHQKEKSDQQQQQQHQSKSTKRFNHNNPFWSDSDENRAGGYQSESQAANRANQYQRKILIIDIITFDIFSAFTLHQSFGDIISMRTSLLAFCQLANPMSNQFSSRIVRIGPTGRYEHLLSFSDVVDFMISVPEPSKLVDKQLSGAGKRGNEANQRYSSIKRLLPASFSPTYSDEEAQVAAGGGTLSKYYRSLMRRQSTVCDPDESLAVGAKQDDQIENSANRNHYDNTCNSTSNELPKSCRALINSYLVSDADDVMETNYMPVNMVFIFRNGKIALFEFTESYAIHTRESQLDRYDYSKVIDVSKNGDDFIITIMTVFDKLIKVVI